MKILLDECLPIAFRHSFPDHDVRSADWAGLKGMKNGTLLRAAEERGYEVLLTTDQGIPYQQSSMDRRISVLVVCAITNKLDDLLALVPSIQAELARLRSGFVVFVR
jgi:predicted nuclease of predicted toxin-antitoxin system